MLLWNDFTMGILSVSHLRGGQRNILRVVGIEILIPEPEVGIDHNWVAGFGFSEVGFVRNSEFGFQ